MTFRLIKEHGTTPKAFEREFALEILKSDKLRVTILIGVILSALLIVLIVALLDFEQFQQSFHGSFRGFITTFITVIGVALVCLVVERVVKGDWGQACDLRFSVTRHRSNVEESRSHRFRIATSQA